jgi:site-specific recombinase XerD
VLLTSYDIDSILLQILEDTEKHDIYSFMLFQSLYNTGLRINELIEYSRLTQIDDNTILVSTEKFSNPRTINISLLNNIYSQAFTTNSLHKFIRSYSYYNSAFTNRLLYFKNIKIGEKQATTHLFRHNYIKKLYLNGFNCNQISAIIGERVVKNTQGYIDSIITADY